MTSSYGGWSASFGITAVPHGFRSILHSMVQ